MSAPFRKSSLAPGTRFAVNGRTGTCYEIVDDTILVGWEECIDQETGVVTRETTALVSMEDLGHLAGTGSLHILALPGSGSEDEEARRNRIENFKPESNATHRALYRLSYIEAIEDLIKSGQLPRKLRRQDIATHLDEIEAARRARRKRKRAAGGGRIRAGGREEASIECECARSIHDWWKGFTADPTLGVYDNYIRCGNRTPRYSGEEVAFFRSIIDEKLTLERPHLEAIYASVQAAVKVENAERRVADPPRLPLTRPGRAFISKLIKSMSPVDFWTRSQGSEIAYRDRHTLGEGLRLTRPLERVEIDEQTVDLMVLLRSTAVIDALGREGLAALAFDVTKARVTLSAAIDCYTGCLLGFQITNRYRRCLATH